METLYPPATSPERDQDEAAIEDNRDRVADGDWTPMILPGNTANATTNVEANVLRIPGGIATDSLNREQTAAGPILQPDRSPKSRDRRVAVDDGVG